MSELSASVGMERGGARSSSSPLSLLSGPALVLPGACRGCLFVSSRSRLHSGRASLSGSPRARGGGGLADCTIAIRGDLSHAVASAAAPSPRLQSCALWISLLGAEGRHLDSRARTSPVAFPCRP